MKCPTCGIDRKKEVEEKERLLNRDFNRKLFLIITCSMVLSFFLEYEKQLSYQLSYIFMISSVFYVWLLKVNSSSTSTIQEKLGSVVLNVCGIIISFIFSYATVSYINGLPNPGYNVGFLHFWSGVLILGSIMSKSLVL